MKCPFRTITKYEYADLGETGRVVLDNVMTDYPDCYGTDCPLWKWDVDSRSYCCTQSNFLMED